ncbi:putative C6 transcription factor [Penicillium brasilianum]|uniref:Putative C6 transcription factor n=1 Tax=Penicillium brasilianum TaxID=104259 RepID=A0A1S9RMW8_PENBI|nr:putative C6 transcription factor [Penicillium brasilianum]
MSEDEQRDEYVASLKDRLSRVEALLKAAGILHEDYISPDELSDDDYDPSDEKGNLFSRRPQSSGQTSQVSFASRASSGEVDYFPSVGDMEAARIFRAHERDDSRYFGRSCSLSMLSRGGIEWIKSKTGDVSFLKILNTDSIHDNPWTQWRPDVFHDLFASRVYKPLPPRSEVFSLIKDYFNTANRLFPIYHEETFMKMVEWQYTQQTCDDSARWASINMVLCLAYEFRFSNSLKPEKDREKARLYFKNAMSVFTELALRRTDLLSVQALLSMAFFLRGNSGTQSALPFITAAMRSSQRMGLHRDVPRPELSLVEQEQRRRVFWVALTVDQSTCLRVGNAPSQHPEDFDVPLPEELEDDRNSTSSTNIPFFRQLCRMSLIKSRIFYQLYSAKALLKSPHEIYQSVKELDAELREWRRDYPFDDDPRQKVAEPNFLMGFAAIGLHFAYFNALIMVHRIPLLLNYLINEREEPPELKALSKAHAAKSSVICVTAARNTLRMVNNMPWGDIAWVWSLLYYIFLAAATIFSHIIRDTRHAQIQEDLQSLNMVATFFATLSHPGDGPAHYAGFMTRMSANLERIAKLAIERGEKRACSPDDHGHQSQQPGAKRHNQRSSRSHAKARHQPSTLRTSTTPDSTRSHPHFSSTAPHVSNVSTTNYPHMSALSIPEAIEGLPPINSEGYVVPLSPSVTNPFPSSIPSQPSIPPANYPIGLGLQDLNGTSTTDFPSNTIPTWQLGQDTTAQTTESPPLESTQSPFSTSSTTPGTTTFPASWQVPLTADWQFGDNIWSGLFPNETIAASAMAENVQLPILSAESFLDVPPETELDMSASEMGYTGVGMGYNNYMPPRTAQDQRAGQDPAEMSWPNGFLGLF